jgi:hypothetical protein
MEGLCLKGGDFETGIPGNSKPDFTIDNKANGEK